MRTLSSLLLVLLLASCFAVAQPAAAAANTIKLPAPDTTGGITLNAALATRRSVRSYAETKLTMAEISQLVWAAQGITDAKGHRTAPSAHGQYFLHLYLATADGFFEYLPKTHELAQLSKSDLRTKLSGQATVHHAPAVFLIAGEYGRASSMGGPETGMRFVNLEAGHAAQNLLLEATALKLAGVPVGGVEPKQAAEAANLPASLTPIYLVPVGHGK